MSAGDTLRGALKLALWTLLFGLDRLSVGVERFRHGHLDAGAPRPAQLPPLFQGSAPNQPRQTTGLPSTGLPGSPAAALYVAPLYVAPSPSPFGTHIPLPKTIEEKRTVNVDQDLSGDMVKVVQYCIVSVATGAIDNAAVLQEMRTVAFGDDMTAADFSSWMLSKLIPEDFRPCPFPWPWPWPCRLLLNLAKLDDEGPNALTEEERGELQDKLPPALLNLEKDQRELAGNIASLYQAIDSCTPQKSGKERLKEQILELNPKLTPSIIDEILENRKWWRVGFHVVSRFSPADINWDIAEVKASGDQAASLKKIAEILQDWPPAR